MGVRKFFPSLVTKYKDVKFVFSKKDLNNSSSNGVVEKIPENNYLVTAVDNLYLDTNCLIHPVCLKIYHENKSLFITNPNRLEQLMIIGVIEYIEQIIQNVAPKNKVMISIDGVAPRAKIGQQHERRFRAIEDNKMREKISKRYNVEYQKPWNNSAITPGTEFMSKITNGIINYIVSKSKYNVTNDKVKYIFSSAYTGGEGEHKILQEIRNENIIENNLVRVIYGLDADLLYLSMAAQASKMFLIRELTEFQNMDSDDGFCFVSVDLMKECIYSDMIENLYIDSIAVQTEFENLSDYKSNFIRDYVFFGFMIGNDFLHAIPSVNLDFNRQHSGLNVLIESYKNVFGQINDGLTCDYHFIIRKNGNKITISYEFIKLLFCELNSLEEEYFRDTYKFKRYIKPGPMPYTSFAEEMADRENMKFNVPNIFQLGARNVTLNESKQRYYKHYEMNDCIDLCIEEYFGGLLWNGYYYFDTCADYLWSYNRKKTPFASDIYLWLLNNEEKFNSLQDKYPTVFKNEKAITPLEQLYMVLPVQSAFLLPSGAKRHMIADPNHFPESVTLDYQRICKLWQAAPNVTMLHYTEAKQVIRILNLTEEEKERNKYKKPFVMNV
jgi:5'-3' exonuclease